MRLSYVLIWCWRENKARKLLENCHRLSFLRHSSKKRWSIAGGRLASMRRTWKLCCIRARRWSDYGGRRKHSRPTKPCYSWSQRGSASSVSTSPKQRRWWRRWRKKRPQPHSSTAKRTALLKTAILKGRTNVPGSPVRIKELLSGEQFIHSCSGFLNLSTPEHFQEVCILL